MHIDEVTPDTLFRDAARAWLEYYATSENAYPPTVNTYGIQAERSLGAAPELNLPLRELTGAKVKEAHAGRDRWYRGVFVRVFNGLAYYGAIPSDMSDLSKSAHRELEKGGWARDRRDERIRERESAQSSAS